MLLKKTKSMLEPPTKSAYRKVASFEVRVVDKYVPDRLLLFYLNMLDKHVPPKAIDGVISGIDKLPPKVRSSIIKAIDEYDPDTAASSRKVSAFMSAVYKYVPDRIIPLESAEDWSNVKMKFHIPTLISRQGKDNS